MSRIRQVSSGFFLVVGLLALPVATVLAAGKGEAKAEGGGFTSAKVCGGCHTAIYEGWKGSMHANAVSDPIFDAVFLEVSRETGGKSDPLCLSCHAPTTRVTGDFKLKGTLGREGVTCDFCHSVLKVTVGARDPYTVAPGKDKWGPLQGVSSPAHPASYSELFKKSELCGGCHEFANEAGVPLFETYSEWKKSPQAQEGKVCQTCHMPEIAGLVVPPRVKPTNEIYINSHEAAGGHFVEQLKKAVTVKVVETKRTGDRLRVAVRIENVGSGHKVPTGIPTRKLVLRLQGTSGGEPFFSVDKVYRKIVVDADGKVIDKDSDLFLKAVKVKEDNRLEPRKPRTEIFEMLVPEGKPVEIEAKAYYLYQPRLIQEAEMKVDLGSEKVSVPAP